VYKSGYNYDKEQFSLRKLKRNLEEDREAKGMMSICILKITKKSMYLANPIKTIIGTQVKSI
jgi:hypothetical protein